MEALAAMKRMVTLGDNTSEVYEHKNIVTQRDVPRPSSTSPDHKKSPDRNPSPANNEKSLTVEIDSSFFDKEILDSKEENYLRMLTEQFHIAINLINKEKERVLKDNNYCINNKAIDFEISRGITYKFDEIEGDVTVDSFKRGLVRVGVKQENQKALDFLMLFNLQGAGAASFSIVSGIVSLLNKIINTGKIVNQLEKNQFKQKKVSDLDLENGQITPLNPITEITETILIKHISYQDGSESTVGEIKIVAEVDNNTLNYKFDSIRIIFCNKEYIALFEKYLKHIGFKRLPKENSSSMVKTTAPMEGEHRSNEETLLLPDYRLFPYTLNELKLIKKNPTLIRVNDCQLSPQYSSNSLAQDDTEKEKIGLPQTRSERQAMLLQNSKKILQITQQSIQDHLRSAANKNSDDEELLDKITHSVTILSNIERDMSTLDDGEFNNNLSTNLQYLSVNISKICGVLERNNALVWINNSNKSVKSSCEIVLEHLRIVLDAFESSENFVLNLQHSAIAQFITIKTNFLAEYKLKQKDHQHVECNKDCNNDDKQPLDENKVEEIMNGLHHDFLYSFKYMQYDSGHDKVQSSLSDFVLLSMQLRCAIAEINQKKYWCNEKIKDLKKIVNAKSGKPLSVARDDMLKQLECYKKILNCYDGTIKILQNVLGEINCHFYTQDFDMTGLHPRNIFSEKSTPDPRHASLGFMEYIAFQANKEFDGQLEQFSFFDYIFPWRWNSYREKLRNDTYYNLNQTFLDTHKTPQKKFTEMKRIIEKNRPSLLNIFRRAERKKYEELKNQAYLLCLLDAFGRAYLTPYELSDELLKYINKKAPTNRSQIKAYADDLRTMCMGFERVVDSKKLKELTSNLAHYRLSSTAKTCTKLLKQNIEYVRLDNLFLNESGSQSESRSSLSSSSEDIQKVILQEDGLKQDKLDAPSSVTLSPCPSV